MANQETAVTVIEQSAGDAMVEWTLDDFPVEAFNRLVPTQTLMLPTDLLRPVVQIVKLNPDPNGGDVYHSADMPDGHSAPTRVGLRKFATAAGISIIAEQRVDDGRDPDVIEVTCIAEMLMPTGQRIRVPGTKRIDLNAQVWKSPAHRGKYKSFFQEHVSSRAQNRAIRGLLSLRGSYPTEVYNRPFAVVSFAPNMNHPEVRSRILDAMVPALSAGFGPAAGSTPQLAAGSPIDVTPAPEEDPAPSTPTVMPGETLAAAQTRPLTPGRAPKADADSRTQAAAAPGASGAGTEPEEPAWMRGGATAQESKAPSLRDIVAERLADEGQPTGPVTAKQGARIGEIFAPFEADRNRIVRRGIRALGHDTDNLTAAQARAIAMAHDELGTAAFLAEWTELAS